MLLFLNNLNEFLNLYMMKRIILSVWLLLLLVIFSCSRVTSIKENDSVLSENSVVAIKTITEYQMESVCGLITEEESDFIDENMNSKIESSVVYKKAAHTKSLIEETDVTSPELVPVCEAVSQELDIYNDGHAEMTILKQIGPEGNPAVALHDTPVDMSLYVAKVIVKDGFQRSYNADGILLYEVPVENIDYSSYITALKEIMQQVEAETNAETKAGIKRDVNWLRRKMESYSVETRASGSNLFDYSVKELPNGNVLLEQTTCMGTKFDMVRLTSRIELSSDITRVERSESWENLVLKEKKEYEYDMSNEKLKSNLIPMTGMGEYNPKVVKTKRVVFMHDGTPLLNTTIERYKRNQSYYFFNK